MTGTEVMAVLVGWHECAQVQCWGVVAEVYDTYTYSDVGFDGDACPPCIVMQPPLTTLQTWMDTQDRIDMVWEEQVRLHSCHVHAAHNIFHVKEVPAAMCRNCSQT